MDIYFIELVRYIHLNPIRAGLVEDVDELGWCAYSGHSVLMGKAKNPWQDTEGVLGMFGGKVGVARRAYRAFLEKGIAEGKRQRIVEARSLLCFWAVRELGLPMSSLARKLGISIPAVSESVTRGRRIEEAKGFHLQGT